MKGQKKVKDPLILFQAQSAIYNHSDCSQLQMKTIQIAFVGSINAGKTSLVRRCLHNQFQQTTQPTIGLQFHTTTITIGAQTYKCNFIDSQGFDNNLGVIMIPQLKHFHGFIVVYDVTQDASFTNSKLCYQQILEHCQVENQNVAFVGNKIDLQRKVPYQQANEYCLQKDIYYVQTSAKNNNHIQKIIERIAKDLICSGKIKSQKNIRKKENVLTLTKKALKQNLQQGCLKRFLSKLKGLFGWIK